ncbi:hypothetical protein ACFVJV_33425 [Streptomyces prasinus]|uniref:hypothetical protein n=1 Tax=Streptomyces prasinus TaxID=67345 RepID=UPI00363FA376
MDSAPPSYQGHRYPAEIIAYCVWRYHRFPLSYREAGELLQQHGGRCQVERVLEGVSRFGAFWLRW